MEKFVDPGAVRHGNFINYYDFNSAEERLELLPTDDKIWNQHLDDPLETHFIVLDVGCNAGNFTQLLYTFLLERTKKKVIILGIDIDSTLIKRANEQNKHRESVMYLCYDFMDQSKDVFKGFLHKQNKLCFDAVFCLSITMWIHLNHGDDGLKQFLDRIHSLSQLLVIEPQPWRCYQRAARRMKRAANTTFPLLATLEIKRTVEYEIKRHLKDTCNLENVFESVPTKWNRRICIYKRSQ